MQLTIAHLNAQRELVTALALADPALRADMDSLNFWSAGNFEVRDVSCVGIVREGLDLVAACLIKGKPSVRRVLVPFPSPWKTKPRSSAHSYPLPSALGGLKTQGQ